MAKATAHSLSDPACRGMYYRGLNNLNRALGAYFTRTIVRNPQNTYIKGFKGSRAKFRRGFRV